MADEFKALGNGGGDGLFVIKTELPEVIELKSKLKTLKDGKGRVEKSLREAQDLSVTLDHRLLKDQRLSGKAKELEKSVKAIDTYLQDRGPLSMHASWGKGRVPI